MASVSSFVGGASDPRRTPRPKATAPAARGLPGRPRLLRSRDLTCLTGIVRPGFLTGARQAPDHHAGRGGTGQEDQRAPTGEAADLLDHAPDAELVGPIGQAVELVARLLGHLSAAAGFVGPAVAQGLELAGRLSGGAGEVPQALVELLLHLAAGAIEHGAGLVDGLAGHRAQLLGGHIGHGLGLVASGGGHCLALIGGDTGSVARRGLRSIGGGGLRRGVGHGNSLWRRMAVDAVQANYPRAARAHLDHPSGGWACLSAARGALRSPGRVIDVLLRLAVIRRGSPG